MVNSVGKPQICPESTIESAGRRSVIRKVAAATVGAAVASSILGNVIPESSASSASDPTNLVAQNSLIVDKSGMNNGCWRACYQQACGCFPCYSWYSYPKAHSLLFGPSGRVYVPVCGGCGVFCQLAAESAPGAAISSPQNSCSLNPKGLNFWTCHNLHISITDCGKVGMGALCPSSVPSAQLTVVGSNVIAQFNNKASSGDKSSLVQIATTGGTKPAAWNIGAAGACNAIKESAGMFYVQKTTSKKAAVVVSNAGNLGISTPSPKTSLQIGGSLSLHTLSVSTSYQMRATDYAVLAGASTSGIIVTLPPAATGSGMIVFVKKTDSSSFSVTVSASGSDNIEGSASMALKKQYDSLELISDGTTNWYILT